MKPLRIGSRGSQLALWQAQHVRERIARGCGVESEIVIIKTSGDKFSTAAFNEIGVKGVFIKELEEALAAGRIDAAVHSMKDVPSRRDMSPGMSIATVLRRNDPRDCLVSRSGAPLADLPRGSRVGTSSLRRQSQLRNFRGDLRIEHLRGNVDTRLRKLEAGEFDAIVLAKAGLDRLGWSEKITEVIPPEIILPAAGQGAMGIEIRERDAEAFSFLRKLNDEQTEREIAAERALLDELQGGCQVPLGAWARAENEDNGAGAGSSSAGVPVSVLIKMDACVASEDGAECIRRSATARCENLHDAENLGRRLAQEMLDSGAARLLRLAGRSVSGR